MNEITFKLKTEFIQLSQLLKATDLCDSGGLAKHFIQGGAVKVDGEVETTVRKKIRPGQKVEFEGSLILVT